MGTIAKWPFGLILLFWLVMNGLLWRAEFSGARDHAGAAVAVQNVWERIVTAPDSSSLEVFHKGQKLGVCRWIASVTEARPGAAAGAGETSPDGMVRAITGYTIDFDGNLILRDLGGNLRFYVRVTLATNQAWQSVLTRMTLKPTSWEVLADRERAQVVLRLNDKGAETQTVFDFKDLADPQKWLADFDLPLPLQVMLQSAAMPSAAPEGAPVPRLGLEWEARTDSLKIGSASVRVYRLQAHLLDRYQVVVFVSRAGEILRVELPGEVTMINYALTSL
jgi:hypothetical protein